MLHRRAFLLWIFTSSCFAQNSELFQAARQGDLEKLRGLARDQANINLRGPHQRTALHEAAANCRLEAVTLLLTSGWDAFAVDDEGRNLLTYSLNCPKMSPQTLNAFLFPARGSAPDKSVPSFRSEKFPWSLHSAVAHGQIDLASMLLRMGAKANETSPEGNRPLDISCLKGDARATRLLLDSGADPKVRNQAGSTPLHDAALSGNAEVIELLLAHGADVNATDRESGSTPLHLAASFGRLEAVQTLVRHGADLSLKSGKGLTALESAINNNQEDVAAFLRRATVVTRP